MFIALTLVFLSAADGAKSWTPLDVSHCENVFQLTEKVYSGGEPHGDAAMKALAEQGIKTIVSVDGARPDVETAKKYGMRYIHLPIGYDGFARERGLQFGRVLTDAEGPVYFHCHHGKHRGPAAVAAGMEAAGQWAPEAADAFLKAAGTSPKYTGLYAFVNEFTLPTAEEFAAVDADFPEVADLPPYQESMASIDRRKDNLALAEAAGWKTPPDHPDVSPVHEALQLREIFTELIRLELDADRPADYREHMAGALAAAESLESALNRSDYARATQSFKALTATCSACHDSYRN